VLDHVVEVHPRPEEALSDGEQALTFDMFDEMMAAVVPIHEVVRPFHGDPGAEPVPAAAAR